MLRHMANHIKVQTDGPEHRQQRVEANRGFAVLYRVNGSPAYSGHKGDVILIQT